MKLLQEICGSLTDHNEDLVWFQPDCAAVLDGATSLGKTDLNAVWFTKEFMTHFKNSLNESLPLSECVNQAIRKSFVAFQKQALDVTPEYYPSASGIFIRQNENTLQILSIGDCTGFLYLKNGCIQKIYDPSVERFDQEVVKALVAMRRETGKDIADLVHTPEIQSKLIHNRKKMNQPDGYSVLSFNMASCSPEDIRTFRTEDITHILLHTDGFSSKESLFQTPELNLTEIYDSLRLEEQRDSSLNKRPRFKVSDDASALLVAL